MHSPSATLLVELGSGGNPSTAGDATTERRTSIAGIARMTRT